MFVLRRIATGFLAASLPFLLFATAFDFGFVRTIGHPDKVKQIISESGIYRSVVPSALAQAGTISTSVGNIPASDPIIKNAAAAAISPQIVQQNTEKALDSVYAWLEGKTPTPMFNINLASQKSVFAASAAQSLQSKLSSLPLCTTYASAANFNPYTSTCRPPGVSPSVIAANLKQQLLTNQDFLKDPVVNAGSIKTGGSDKSVFTNQLKQAPTAYQWAMRMPLILSLLSVLTIIEIVMFSPSRRHGLRRVGIILIVVGVLMLVFAWGLSYGVSHQVMPRIAVSNEVLQSDIKSVATDISQAISANYWLFGGIYSALGALAIGVPIFIHKQHKGSVAVNTASESVVTGQKPAPTKSRK